MFPILILAVQFCLLNSTGTGLNASASNITSMPGMLQYENSSPCLYNNDLIGLGLLAIIMVVAFGITALRFDVAVAGVISAWVGTFVTLFLIQLSLLPANSIGIALGLTIIFTLILLLRGALDPY